MKNHPLPSTLPLMLMGIVLIVFGIIAIAAPAVAGKTVVTVIAGVLIVAGIVQLVSGWRAEGWSHRLPPLILGAITVLAGIGMLADKYLTLGILTWLLTAFFIVEGIWKIVGSFNYRPARGWVSLLISGVLTLGLGLLIFIGWPSSKEWAIGLLVGVDLLSTGISLMVVAATIKALEDVVEEELQQARAVEPAAESAAENQSAE